MKNNGHSHGPLGKPMGHYSEYHPEHLFPIPRKNARDELGIGADLPFFGEDIWNAYEISWLDLQGKPRIAIGTFRFPAATENIIESKSVKLYLNSCNQTKFVSPDAVAETLKNDFSMIAKGDVSVSLVPPERFHEFGLAEPKGICLDDVDIEIDQFTPCSGLLRSGGGKIVERLYSNLLRTQCPVTGQPDWATIIIDYLGTGIDHEGLLRYLVSFRNHAGFHENCVERIFTDISKRCNPDRLTVYARFTRRGGIDINPFRSSFDSTPDNCRFVRQ